MDLTEGQLVTPTLRLCKLLGKGGMGSVWLADQLALQTQVAVKFLSPEMTSSPDAIERFKREATAAAQIRSPHVVQTLEHGLTSEGIPYIVLELLEGEELGARMEREPQLPVGLVALVIQQACKALTKAHSLNIVHRDIKPDNIFLVDVDGEPFVKVLDFGIAKKTDDTSLKMTSTNAMIGTPYYMSPEQAFSSKDVDSRTDLWALAVVAYFALVGDVPFSGETVGAICLAIDRAVYKPVTQLRPELPSGLEAWFSKAFARNLERRFRSAREMADAFATAIGEEPSGPMSAAWSARGGSSLPAPSMSAPSRPRLLIPLLAAGGLVGLGGLALGLSRAAQPPPPAPTSATSAAAVSATPSAPPPAASAPPSVSAPPPPAAAVSSSVPSVEAPPAPSSTTPKGAKPPPKQPPTTSPPPTKPPPVAPPSTKDRGFLFPLFSGSVAPPCCFVGAVSGGCAGRAQPGGQGDRPFAHG